MIARIRAALAAVCLAALLAACATLPDRPPHSAADQAAARVPGFGDIRLWSDAPAQDWLAWREQFKRERFKRERGADTPLEMLAISSGSDKGAFSAGFLSGWSEVGTRPEFDIVSGVSTGALIAPFAFLGPDEDETLTRLYTTINADMVYRTTPVSGLLGGPALATTRPLAGLIETYADDALIDAVAREHTKGRRLLVQTTNLDAERGVVWDMGAIAASKSPRRYELFRKVLLASASIPGLFPPVLLEVEAPSARFAELHVDGGTTSSVLAIPLSVVLESRSDSAHLEGRLTILYNGALAPVFRVSEPRTLAILQRALTASIKAADRRSIRLLQSFAQGNGTVVDVHSMGEEAQDPDLDLFDQKVMQRFYALGRERALAVHGEPGAETRPQP